MSVKLDSHEMEQQDAKVSTSGIFCYSKLIIREVLEFIDEGNLRVAFLLDIDECALTPEKCDRNADCVNTVGSFTCRCSSGYSGDGIVNCNGKYFSTDVFKHQRCKNNFAKHFAQQECQIICALRLWHIHGR